ncbi:hypothetical protein [Gemmatimonas sp.]|uniref:hypothetical protein n=1 Tax=Gemmatimonas sp. TaxID=1962908 RepID=UPI00286E1448|nr:hypothetical protein [Gemmatimonas sp.]
MLTTIRFTPNPMYPTLEALTAHLIAVADDNSDEPLSGVDEDGLFGYVVGYTYELTKAQATDTLRAAREIIASEGL